MKKRLLPLLLVVALLVAAAVFSVSAAQGDTCPGCGATVETWKAWDGTGGLGEGHYYLDGDLITNVHTTLEAGSKTCLDLNGHVWSVSGDYAVGLTTSGDELQIFDSEKGGEIQATGVAGDAAVVKVLNGAKLILRSGTIRQLYTANATTLGAVYVWNSNFDMHGGTITDGYTTSTAATSAGNLLVRGTTSVVNMYGGKITNGYAVVNGGGVTTYGIFTMSGGTISNNVCVGTGTNQGIGGNIVVNGGTPVFKDDAEVKNGVSFGRGANIYNKSANAKFENVSKIDGDIYTVANVKLAGEVYIPMGNSNGILLKSSGAKLTFDDSFVGYDKETEEGSIVYFGVELAAGGSADFTTGGSDYLDSFRNVGRTTGVAVNGTNLKASRATNGSAQTSYCPHCGENAEPVKWYRCAAMYTTADDPDTEDTAVDSNYLVLKSDIAAEYTHFFYYSGMGTGLNFSGEVVIDLAGAAWNTSRRAATISGTNSEFTVLDSVGGGSINARGYHTDLTGSHIANGGVINVAGASAKATVNIYSGKLTLQSTKNNITRGGLIGMNGGDLNIYGGILADGKTTSTTGKSGGNIYMNNGKFTMTGGLITGGEAGGKGGNIYVNNGATVEITGGMILDGKATADMGGNLYLYSGETTISDALIRGGEATGAGKGGNIAIAGKAAYSLNNVTVAAGSSAAGGNIHVEGATSFAVSDATIYDGTATGNGGNINAMVNATLTNCRIYNGKATTGTESRINERSDNVFANKDIVLDNVQVYGDSGYGEMGTGVLAHGKVTLKGHTVLGSQGEPLSCNLYMKTSPNLEVDESFDGLVVISVYHLVDSAIRVEPYGAILNNASYTGDFEGKLYVGNHVTGAGKGYSIWEMGMPEIYKIEEGKLRIAGAVIRNGETIKCYENAAAALVEYNYDNGDLLQIGVGEIELNLDDGNYFIDVHGNSADVNATGDVTINGIDRFNYNADDDLFNEAGMLSVASGNVIFGKSAAYEGYQYAAAIGDSFASFHNIMMDITKVTLRTSSAGIFYKGTWKCDDTLEAYIQNKDLDYGVVVSTTDMPEAGFVTENTENATPNLYSSYGGTTFESGVEKTGVAVSNILRAVGNTADYRTKDENIRYSDMDIFATAYLFLGDGAYIVGGEGAQLSLMDVLKKVDEALVADPTFGTEGNTGAAELMAKFYTNFKNEGLTEAIANYGYTFNAIFK